MKKSSLDFSRRNMTVAALKEQFRAMTRDQLLFVKQLFVSDNQLTSLPQEMFTMTNITMLALNGNRLSELCDDLGQLRKLECLVASNNQLSTIPVAICSLPALKELQLQGNQITSLPPAIRGLTKLTTLYLNNNPLPKAFTNPVRVHSGTQKLLSEISQFYEKNEGGVLEKSPRDEEGTNMRINFLEKQVAHLQRELAIEREGQAKLRESHQKVKKFQSLNMGGGGKKGESLSSLELVREREENEKLSKELLRVKEEMKTLKDEHAREMAQIQMVMAQIREEDLELQSNLKKESMELSRYRAGKSDHAVASLLEIERDELREELENTQYALDCKTAELDQFYANGNDEEEKERLRRECEEKDAQIEELKNEIDHQMKTLNEKDFQLSNLKSQKEKEEQTSENEEALKKEIESLKSQLEKKSIHTNNNNSLPSSSPSSSLPSSSLESAIDILDVNPMVKKHMKECAENEFLMEPKDLAMLNDKYFEKFLENVKGMLAKQVFEDLREGAKK